MKLPGRAREQRSGTRRVAVALVCSATLAAAGLALAAVSPPDDAPLRLPAGRVVEKIATADDPEQQYALYLPKGYASDDRRWPVLLVLDPRGRAVAGVERFLPAAERHGFVVLSSYQSRSDTAPQVTDRALDALLRELTNRYRPDPRRLHLAGMSGTAHAAWRYGQLLEDRVAGVIAAGAGVQTRTQGPPGEARFAYYAIVGNRDFNYHEVLELERHLLATGVDHRVEIFEGFHGWPPAEHTNRALDWMAFQAAKRGLAPTDDALVAAELERARAAATAATDPLDRLRRHRDVMRDFAGLADVAFEAEAARRLETSPEVERRRAQERKLAQAEETYFATRLGPWLARIRDRNRRPPTVRESLVALRVEFLRKRAANLARSHEANSAVRTLDSLYTSVQFYLPDLFERAGDTERELIALKLATEIFPQRPRGFWRLAEAHARAGRHDEAFEALRTATGLGNVDVERLKTDPAWEALRGRPEWQALLDELAAAGR